MQIHPKQMFYKKSTDCVFFIDFQKKMSHYFFEKVKDLT